MESASSHLAHRCTCAGRQCLCLTYYYGQHRVDANLKMPPNTNMIQLPVALEPSVQPLNGDSAIVDHLPLGSLLGLGVCPLVSRVGVNNGPSVVLFPDCRSQLVAGISCVTNHVVRIEWPIGVASLLKQGCCPGHVMNVPLTNINRQGQFVLGVSQNMYLVPHTYFFRPSVLVFTTHPASVSDGLPLRIFPPFDHALMSVLSIATDFPKSGSSLNNRRVSPRRTFLTAREFHRLDSFVPNREKVDWWGMSFGEAKPQTAAMWGLS